MINSTIVHTHSKQQILSSLFQTKVVAVVRIDRSGDFINVAKVLLEGGVKFMEITMTVPNALQSIEETVNQLGNSVYIGAGTVLTGEQASDAISAGASYIVSPVFNDKVVNLCNHENIAVMPGCMTPTEVYNAWNAGADVVKIFPAGVGGPKFFKD